MNDAMTVMAAVGKIRDAMKYADPEWHLRPALEVVLREMGDLERQVDRLAKRLRKFDECVPADAANAALRLARTHHALELVEAVAVEREACAKLCEDDRGWSSTTDMAAAIRARGGQ